MKSLSLVFALKLALSMGVTQDDLVFNNQSPFLNINANAQNLQIQTANQGVGVLNEFKFQGKPGDLIPIAWLNFWQKVTLAGSQLWLIHVSKSFNYPVQWKLVFKLIGPQRMSYYGIWTDESYNVVK